MLDCPQGCRDLGCERIGKLYAHFVSQKAQVSQSCYNTFGINMTADFQHFPKACGIFGKFNFSVNGKCLM